jgi:hypothetical protein
MPGGVGFTPPAPQFLPVNFNDNAIPVPILVAKSEAKGEEKQDFVNKMKGLMSGSGKEKDGKLRVGEYLRYFAKDDDGNYAGTEPQRSWTDVRSMCLRRYRSSMSFCVTRC